MEAMMDDELLIPQAEELEWLEANSFLPEFEEEDNFSINEEVTGENNADIPALAESDHHSQESGVTRKRVWTEENEGSEIIEEFVPNEENRCKRRSLGSAEGGQNEDWLHYSPRKATVVHTASKIDDLMAEVSVQEKILSKFAVEIEGDFIPVTGPNGDRVYAKIQSSKITDGGPKKLRIEKYNDVTDVAGLLSEPIDIILQKLDEKAFLKDFEEREHSPCHLAHSEVSSFSEKLWVEKYAPCFFTELLSDEQTNKEVLLWLKQWDSSIFGSQVRLTTDDVLSALRRHSSAVQHGKYSDSKSFGRGKVVPFRYQNMNSCNVPDGKSEKVNIYSESFTKKATVDHLLEYKVLLLCGPPGLGKTTLAHVAAKHCGYRVIEINASDDRSSSTLESKIIDVVQMTSVTSDAKPKCLVIDEIDGALGEGKGAVEVILKLVAADKKAIFEKSNSTERSISEKHTSRKGQKSASLLRPIICICNDLYAPALRPLRQIAKVHMFVKPTISRVVNRLKYICNKEGLKTNSIALAALAEFTECDIRSCLNTLQFLHKKKEILNILDVGSQVVGHKDITSSCFDIWKQIFQNGKSKRKNSSTFNLCGHKDFEFMYSLLSNRGDYDLTMDAIQENFLKVSYIDPLMKKTVECLNLLGVSDLLHQFVMRTQQMFLHAYQPSLAITIRHLIAHVEKPIIEWPKSIQRCRTMSIERKDLLKLWQNKISPVFARHLSIEYFTEDFVSLFLHILVPPNLRPVALHLFSEKEKDDLAQLVDTMVSYSITYKSSKAENLKGPQRHGIANDVPILALDPPICDFVNFKDYQPAHLGLSQAMKQVLLQEVEKQRILRENSGKSLNLSDEQSKQRQATVVVKTEALHGAITNKSALVDGSMTKFKLSNKDNNRSIPAEAPAGSKLPANNPASFFDRFRQRYSIDSKNNIDTNLKKASTAERDHRPFLFKYNEGFTNAVKRSVKVRELLL